MFYLTMHSTHFIYGYMASDVLVWKHIAKIVVYLYLFSCLYPLEVQAHCPGLTLQVSGLSV